MAVPANLEARSYELTYLVPTSFTDSEASKIADEVTKLVTRHKGQVTKSDSWGKKKMAYRIKHGSSYHAEAYYTHLEFSMPSTEAQAFEKNIYLQPNIVRHLLVVAEPVKVKRTRQAAPKAAEEAEVAAE